jgi:hypothetical protein
MARGLQGAAQRSGLGLFARQPDAGAATAVIPEALLDDDRARPHPALFEAFGREAGVKQPSPNMSPQATPSPSPLVNMKGAPGASVAPMRSIRRA